MAPQGCTAGAPSPFSDERLSAFVDGDLPGSELAQVRQHVDACAACALRAEELRGLARAARALEAPEAPATLWAGIEGALARERRFDWWLSLRPFAVGTLAGAVAVAAIVFVAGGGHGGARETVAVAPASAPPPARDPLLAEAEQEFARAGAVYERSIEKLRGLLADEEAQWSPEVRARYDERLARLDEAISRTREVARLAPTESEGQEQLFAAYQQKIAFLTETVHRGGGSGQAEP
jgi:anti-sigma factor RsiW